jgi:H+/Cl- antiporter ClcA
LVVSSFASAGLTTKKDAYTYYQMPQNSARFDYTPREQSWIDGLSQNSTDLLYLARPMQDVSYVSFGAEHKGACRVGSFSEAATLFLKGGVKGVTMLLTRGAPHIFSAESLLIFLVIYFVLAAYTSGTAVASGLFIPHLLIGGAMGRLVGLLDLWIVNYTCVDLHGIDPATMSVLDWTLSGYRDSLSQCVVPDPGTFAMIGAAAVLGGSGRITMFLAVVMLELTADLQFMPVIALVVIIAGWVGNVFSHGLYHSLVR